MSKLIACENFPHYHCALGGPTTHFDCYFIGQYVGKVPSLSFFKESQGRTGWAIWIADRELKNPKRIQMFVVFYWKMVDS